MKNFFYYFGWTIAIGLVIYLGAKYQIQLQKEMSQTMQIEKYLNFSVIFPIFIGLLLGLPRLIHKIKQQKEWSFNWMKLLVIGLPTLLIVLIYLFLAYIPENVLQYVPEVIFLRNQMIHIVAGVVLGYVLLDSVNDDSVSSLK